MRSLIRRRQKPDRLDPAPSRLAYRLNRLWLRPYFRRAVLLWVPVILCLSAVAYWIVADQRVQKLNDQIAAMRSSIEERPEFMVKLMAIDGASADLSASVRRVIPVDFPISSFDLDLEAMRSEVEQLDGIKRVDMRIQAGGLLQVKIVERIPAVIWRGPEGLMLLDANGARVTEISARSERPDLPVIAGEGAAPFTDEALQILTATQIMSDRILGLQRMAETRWDLVLRTGQRIMLPETDPLDALDRVIALDEMQDLLARDVTHVDMRNGGRPTLRLSSQAVETLREMRVQQLTIEN